MCNGSFFLARTPTYYNQIKYKSLIKHVFCVLCLYSVIRSVYNSILWSLPRTLRSHYHNLGKKRVKT